MGASVMELLANHNPSAFAANNRILETQAANAPAEASQRLAAGQQQLESGQLEMRLKRQQIADADAIKDMYKAAADGDFAGDTGKMRDYLLKSGKISGQGFVGWQNAALGMQEKASVIAKNSAETGDKKVDTTIKQHNQAGDWIDSVNERYKTDPVAAQAMYEEGLPTHRGLASDAQWPAQYDPESGKALSGMLGHAAATLTKAKTQAEIDKEKAETAFKTAETPGATAKSEIEASQAAAIKDFNPQKLKSQVDEVLPPDKYPSENHAAYVMAFNARGQGTAAVQKAITDVADRVGRRESAIAQAKATQPIKIETANAIAGAGANAAAAGGGLDMMAEQALNGTFTSRNPVLMAKVYNRASELAKERGLSNQQVLMERNSAQANKGALTSLTKQYETLKPFAEMAEKNAKILEEKAALVDDLGAPFLNTPVRELEQKFAGNEKVSAFKAALQPVQADFARILNSPTGGGVLSDDARHEMQAAIGAGSTPGQIKAALDVFRKDASNRKEAYEASIADLKGKTVVGAPPPATAEHAAPKATKRYNPATQKLELIKTGPG